jgi:SAM-dependent methyltransferase
MVTAREHYDAVLAPHYSRMFGDFEAQVAEQGALLARLGIDTPRDSGMAVDLGCGPGFQSIALARCGFRVLAIDFCDRLLGELRERARGLRVEAVAGDIRDVASLVPPGVEVTVCMGDTLSHLECEEDVQRVFDGVAARVVDGGRLALTFRDLGGELHGLDRMLPVCAFDDLTVTCVLEYEPATVKVHDLVWARRPDGWRFQKSVYRKLRLGVETVTARLARSGFVVERHDAPGGMVALVGLKLASRDG